MNKKKKKKNRKILYNIKLKLNLVKNPKYRNNNTPPIYIYTK